MPADLSHATGMFGILSFVLPLSLAALLLCAALSDMRDFIIPNRFPALIAALWPCQALVGVLATGDVAPAGQALLIGVLVFAAGAALFRVGLVGGGDVKLMTAASLWAGPGLILPFVLTTFVAGGVLALGLLAVHVGHGLIVGGPAAAVPAMRAAMTRPAPYGVAIGLGGIAVALQLLAAPRIL